MIYLQPKFDDVEVVDAVDDNLNEEVGLSGVVPPRRRRVIATRQTLLRKTDLD